MDKKYTGIRCFKIVAKYLGIHISGIREEEYPDEVDIETKLLLCAKENNIKARLSTISSKTLFRIKHPVILKSKQGEFFIYIKATEDKCVVLYPDKQMPEMIEKQELLEKWDRTVIVLVNKKANKDIYGVKFGFKWFFMTIGKFKKQFAVILLAAFLIQILGVLAPLMTQVVVDKVLSHHSLSTLYTITIGMVIVYVYELILNLAKNYVFIHTTNKVDVILNYRLFKHLFSLPLRYFESRRAGETIARVRELDSIRSFLTGTPLAAVIDFFFVIVYVVILFIYDVPLTLLVLGMIPVFVILSAVSTPLFRKRLDKKFVTGAASQSFLVEAINGIQTVKSFSLENRFQEKWGDLQADYVKASYKASVVSSTSNALAGWVQRVFDLLILFFGAKAVIDGKLSVGQLVAFRMLAGRISSPILRIVQLWQEYQQASLAVKRIGDIFNSPPEPKPETTQSTIPPLRGEIVFDKVRFRYQMDSSEVIKDLSFRIPAGKVIGVVGRSGSGKSTIAKLIQRLYIAESGKITVDGMDIALMNPNELRKQIGVVLQENFMFNGTVRENIAIHYPTASDEEIFRVAKIAGAHDFIMELQNGYDTIIGEKGVALSGGQKQRIAIARAIICNPKILIFDEATSALDYESESIIKRNLKEICKDRTVIMIAHRLSTLSDADRILVIDKGKLVEYAPQEILLKSGGLYASLYNQQKQGD